MIKKILSILLVLLGWQNLYSQTADFTTSTTTICIGGSIQFTDLSSNAASYSWTFVDGGTGQTSTMASPTITYTNPGTFTVILSVANGALSDTKVETNYITVLAAASATLTSATGTDNQPVCVNTPITDIDYVIAGATAATFTGLPPGVTGSFNPTTSGGNVSISGTPTVAGTYNYSFTTSGGNCNPITVTGTIDVGDIPSLTLTSGSIIQNTCINVAISSLQFSIGGSATGATVSGLPTGVSGSVSGSVLTISGTPTVTGAFVYSVTTTGGVCPPITISGSINVDPDITIISAAGTDMQTVCENEAIIDIEYSTGPSITGASATGLPPGVIGTYSAGSFVISGTPTAAGVYNYSLNSTGGPCGMASATGTITVQAAPSLTLALPATDTQTVCISSAITNINYAVGGTATGAIVTGLPTGISGNFNAGTLTISGTSSQLGSFQYIASTTGSPCGADTMVGLITIQDIPTITLVSSTASSAQQSCINTAIDTVIFVFGGSATGAGVTNLPPGVTSTIQNDSILLTGAVNTGGTFNYSVFTTGGACVADTGFGSVTVDDSSSITLTSAAVTDTQIICLGNPISTISYSVQGGNGTATITGLPNGVTSGFFGGSMTISGTPTSAGSHDFMIVSTGGFCPNDTVYGNIQTEDPFVNLTTASVADTQEICLNMPIDTIVYQFGGWAGNATVMNLPQGLSTSIQNDSLLIFGTPTAVGAQPFSVMTSGTVCTADTSFALITVNQNNGVVLVSSVGSNSQIICENQFIDSIIYVLSGAADTAFTYDLPAGVTTTFVNDTLIITGMPSIIGLSTYGVVASGGACMNDTVNGTIEMLSTQMALSSAPYTNDQTVFVDSAIEPIVYSVGGQVTITDLPPGVTFSFTSGTPNSAIISGSPLDTGTFYYVVGYDGACGTNLLVGKILVLATDTTSLVASDSLDLFVPNLFSPNADGYNDTWEIPDLTHFTETSVTVINREGQVVFEDDDYQNTWDGTYGGDELPEATYYYVIRLKGVDSVFKGPITILRNDK